MPFSSLCHALPLRLDSWRALQGSALIVLALLGGADAAAQSAADLSEASRNATRVQREQEERQRAELQQSLGQPRAGQISVPAVPQAGPSVAAGCVDVRALRIDDAPALSPETRARLRRTYTGRCLTLIDIQQVLADIVADYLARGQVGARAYIRSQDASSGTLAIFVVEGKLEKMILNDGGQGSIHLGTAFPGLAGKPVNLRDLEMGLEQVNRLASNHATMDMLPGLDAGDSIIAITNAPTRRWRVLGSADNQGGETTGRNQASVGVAVDNPLNLNDFLNVTYRRAVPTDYARIGSVSKNLSYIVPYGYNTFTLGASESLYISTLRTAGGVDLRSNGNSSNRFVQADRVVYRDQVRRVSVSTALTRRASQNYLAEQLLASSSRTLGIWDVDANLSQQWAGAVWSFNLGFSRGLARFGAATDAPDLPDGAPRAQFRKLRYGVSYYLPLNMASVDWSFSSSLSGQRGLDVLYGTEQFLVGGIYSVRGFVDTTLSGDTGFLVRNDLAARLPVTLLQGWPGVVRPYLGVDYGHVQRRGVDTQAGYLAGAALGVGLSSGAVSLDVFNAWPIGMSPGLRRDSSRLYVQLRATL
jgi:hemolysin activation/secretion protein